MTQAEDIARILLLANADLGAARQAFKEAFGVSHDDPSIDANLERLTLALLLRKGKRGRLPVAKHVRRGDNLVIKDAQQLKAELIAAGKSATDAEAEAADKIAATDKRRRPLSADQLHYALRHGGKPRRGKT